MWRYFPPTKHWLRPFVEFGQSPVPALFTLITKLRVLARTNDVIVTGICNRTDFLQPFLSKHP